MADITLLADTVTVATQQGLGFAKLLHRQNFIPNLSLAISDSPADQSAGARQISAAIVDALAPPPVKPNRHRTVRRTHIRKKGRTRRMSGDFDDTGEEYGYYGGDNDGPFGGAGGCGGGAGGGGPNFDKSGGENWDESSWSSSSIFAYSFLYEVICWIALSNCVHFAFNKVMRILAHLIDDTDRERFR